MRRRQTTFLSICHIAQKKRLSFVQVNLVVLLFRLVTAVVVLVKVGSHAVVPAAPETVLAVAVAVAVALAHVAPVLPGAAGVAAAASLA